MKLAVAVFALLLVLSGVAFADMVSGTVASIDVDGKSFELEQLNPDTGIAEKVRIWVSDTTTYPEDIAGLEDLIEGDAVELEVDKDAATGNWIVKSVQFSEEEYEEAPAEVAEGEAAEEEEAS
jgi:hypothetical protein